MNNYFNLLRGVCLGVIEIVDGIYHVGVDDKKTKFFESIWPIPEGISYNAYLIVDDKVALIEGGVKQDFSREFLKKLESIIDLDELDYIIVNHMEPDHTGTLPLLYKMAKRAKIIISKMGKRMLKSFYGIEDEERIITVSDFDELSLGKRKLKFIMTPGVHWPETMMTYEERSKILFSSDAFGTYGSLDGSLFDSEVDLEVFLERAKRYFVNIVGMYAIQAKNALKKLSKFEIRIIAPSHGPIWKEHIKLILDLYTKLTSKEEEAKVLIVYGSMYGFTEEAVEVMARLLKENGIKTIIYNATYVHPSYSLSEAWDSKIIIFAFPTYDAGPFIPVYTTAYYIIRKNIMNKKFAILGSYGWSGKGYMELVRMLEAKKWKLIEPIIECNGKVKKDDLEKIKELVEKIIKEVKA